MSLPVGSVRAAGTAESDRFADRRIFVSIVAYRDADVARTVRSALDSAADPTRLRFGICLQYDDETREVLSPWSEDPRFEIDGVPSADSEGVCWARARAQALYDGEPFHLQIDAHMRFADAWDARSIAMLAAVDCERPILTNYPHAFRVDPEGREEREPTDAPRRLGLEPSRPPGSLRQRAEPAPASDRPGRHWLLGAGHVFTVGRFCRDVPYDPEIYYGGEEISLAVRAYTHGYDLFYPNESVVWHWYDRGAPLHWSDHPGHSRIDRRAQQRVRRLIGGDDSHVGPYGLGKRRTVAGYEHLSGMTLPPSSEG